MINHDPLFGTSYGYGYGYEYGYGYRYGYRYGYGYDYGYDYGYATCLIVVLLLCSRRLFQAQKISSAHPIAHFTNHSTPFVLVLAIVGTHDVLPIASLQTEAVWFVQNGVFGACQVRAVTQRNLTRCSSLDGSLVIFVIEQFIAVNYKIA